MKNEKKQKNSKHEIRNSKQITKTDHRSPKNERGAALIMALSVLTLLTIMALAFSVSMRLEQRISRTSQEQLSALFIAKAGLFYALETLDEEYELDLTNCATYGTDSNQPSDSSLEIWKTRFLQSVDGSLDLDGDSVKGDAGWFYLHDKADGRVIGRFAILIQDESGKININTAGNNKQNQGYGPYEVNLRTLQGVGDSTATQIERYRYGGPRKQSYSSSGSYSPGQNNYDDDNNNSVFENDGIDNDADGMIDDINEGIDDPYEYTPQYPYNDDTPFCAFEELFQVYGIGDTILDNNKNSITTVSNTTNRFYNGSSWTKKMNCNYIQEATLLYQLLENQGLSPANALRHSANIIDYADRDTYPTVCGPYNGENLFFGLEGLQITEVKNSLSAIPLENDDTTWPGYSASGDWVEEPNVHRVYMLNLTANTLTFTHNFTWNWDRGGTYDMLIRAGPNNWHTFTYDLEGKTGSITGGNAIGGINDVTVSQDGIINLSVSVDVPPNTTRRVEFDVLRVLAGRFVEIINISKQSIALISSHNLNVGGSLSTQEEGLPATISGGTDYPLGSSYTVTGAVPPLYNYFFIADSLYAIDVLAGSVIDGSWNDSDNEKGKLFVVTPTSSAPFVLNQDLFFTDDQDRVLALMPESSFNATYNINGFRSDVTGTWSNSSRSRYSPVDYSDCCDIHATLWHTTSNITPGSQNDGTINDDSGDNKAFWQIKDRPFVSCGEIGQVFQGTTENDTLVPTEIENVLNRLTTEHQRLEAENADSVPTGWTVHTNGFDGTTRYQAPAASGSWTWTWSFNPTSWWNKPFHLTNGASYHVFLFGEYGDDFEMAAGTDRIVLPSHGVYCGEYSVSSVGSTFQLSLTLVGNGSNRPVIDFIILSPEQTTPGKININTAPETVLNGLQLSSTTTAIIGGRPYAHIGQLLNGSKANLSESEFQKIANCVTTRSDLFTIITQGEVIADINKNGVEGDGTDKIKGRLKIRAIIDRNPAFANPASSKKYKILYIRYAQID
ncbi:hypothetical protein ACFL1T_01545 [Chlamydiota bacterium]